MKYLMEMSRLANYTIGKVIVGGLRKAVAGWELPQIPVRIALIEARLIVASFALWFFGHAFCSFHD